MVYNAKSLEINDAIKIARKLAAEDGNTESLD